MTDCPTNERLQSRRTGDERRKAFRRASDNSTMGWCARTMGAVIALTSVVSVGASATISVLLLNYIGYVTQARIDAIRFDVNQLTTQIDRLHYRRTK
jgi:outer membrane murein-binding lipoprotein Lpp